MTQPERPNPFGLPGKWLRTAIHTHTTGSDGAVSPEQAMAVYRQHGFDAVIFGDHWHVTMPAAADGLLILPGAELDVRIPGEPAGFHFMVVGPQAGLLEQVRPLREKPDPYRMAAELAGGCQHLSVAHPYWSALTTEIMAKLTGPVALEVYNHGCEVEDGLGYSMYVWDQLLARGQRWDGLAVDDAHWRRGDDFCGGWVMLKTASAGERAVYDALRAGCFYSSMAPEIMDVQMTGRRKFAVRTSPARTILFRCNGSLGTGLHSAAPGQMLSQAEHEIPDRARFVRIEVTDAEGRKAWTNPFYL